MAAYVKSTKYIPAFILCLIVYVNTNALAFQDPYLKEYFTKAISLFEAQQYNEAVLLFEKIIEIEKDKGEFYYSPFAEIYIEKSRNKNIVIVPQKKEAKRTVSNTAVGVGDTFQARQGTLSMHGKMESLESVPYRSWKVSPMQIQEPKQSVYDAVLDNYEAKPVVPQKIDTPKEVKEPEVLEPAVRSLTKEPEKVEVPRIAIMENPDTKIYSTFQWTINEKIENGLENLDNETLQFFDDQRFRDIVSEIKQQKKLHR